jgi:hypothetical protein
VRIFFGDGGFVPPDTGCQSITRTFTPYPEYNSGELAHEFSVNACVPCGEDAEMELNWSASNPSVTFMFTGELPTVEELNALIDDAGFHFDHGPFQSSTDVVDGPC